MNFIQLQSNQSITIGNKFTISKSKLNIVMSIVLAGVAFAVFKIIKKLMSNRQLTVKLSQKEDIKPKAKFKEKIKSNSTDVDTITSSESECEDERTNIIDIVDILKDNTPTPAPTEIKDSVDKTTEEDSDFIPEDLDPEYYDPKPSEPENECKLFELVPEKEAKFKDVWRDFRTRAGKSLYNIDIVPVTLSPLEYNTSDENTISLSEEEFAEFREFILKENIYISEERHVVKCNDRFYLESTDSCIDYIRYLIKTSKDHPLKDVPASRIVFLCNYADKINIDKDLLDSVKHLMYKAPKISDKVIYNYVRKESLEDNANLSQNNEDTSKLIEKTLFLDKRVLIKLVEKQAERDLKTEDIIALGNYHPEFDENHIEFLKDRVPNIKYRTYNKVYGPVNGNKDFIPIIKLE